MAKRDKRRNRKLWSYTAGHYPHSVRVYERGGVIYMAAHHTDKRGEYRKSLGHSDRELARQYADEQATKLRKGSSQFFAPRPTVGRILALYRLHRTPAKAKQGQQEDDRQIALWLEVLGRDFDLSRFSRREWDGFVRVRRSGEINGRGELVPEGERRQPGDRTIQKDLVFLRAVCRWASNWRDDSGRLLLESDPTRGHQVPREKNPKQPVATHDRLDAIRSVYRQPRMRIQRGKRAEVESYLPEIFEIAAGTGRRISPVCGLRFEDLELEATAAAPWGAIAWPQDTDKMGKAWRCPISADVRQAVESALRKRQQIGPGPLFPAPKDSRKPVRYELVSKWLEEAERLAKLPRQDGSLWHAYRRLWATSRKGLPDVDVAKAGGWSSLAALKMAYQHPDDATMLQVVTQGAELREVR